MALWSPRSDAYGQRSVLASAPAPGGSKSKPGTARSACESKPLAAIASAPGRGGGGSSPRDGSPSARGRGPSTQGTAQKLLARLENAEPVTSRRGSTAQDVDRMAAMLDQRVTQVTQTEATRFQMLADQAQRLAEGLQSMRVAREIQEERRQKELRMLENNAQQDFHKLWEDRRALEARLEERGAQILAEREQEFRQRAMQPGASEEGVAQRIGDHVQRLQGMLASQREARLEYGERISSSLEVEFQKVQDAVSAEQSLRFEAERTMQRMVQDVCGRMNGEVQQEREQRELVQSRLLGLLEETCGRIEVTYSDPSLKAALPETTRAAARAARPARAPSL